MTLVVHPSFHTCHAGRAAQRRSSQGAEPAGEGAAQRPKPNADHNRAEFQERQRAEIHMFAARMVQRPKTHAPCGSEVSLVPGSCGARLCPGGWLLQFGPALCQTGICISTIWLPRARASSQAGPAATTPHHFPPPPPLKQMKLPLLSVSPSNSNGPRERGRTRFRLRVRDQRRDARPIQPPPKPGRSRHGQSLAMATSFNVRAQRSSQCHLRALPPTHTHAHMHTWSARFQGR